MPSATATLCAALLGFFMITVDALAVNVGLATMGRQLHTATSGLQWVVDGYTLMFAALLLSAGALSDRIGARRAYGSGTAAFTLASVACGAAPGLGALVAARVLQGCAAAVMLPSSLALVRQAYADQDRRRRAIALWVAAGASAVAIGPVAGGLLIAAWSWRGIFLINVPVGAAVLFLLSRVARSPRRPTPLDLGGQVLAVLALGGLTYGVIEGGSAGYGAPRVMTALAVALAAGIAFAITESRTASPAVPLTLFRQQAAVSAIAGGFAASMAFYGIVFVIGLYAQQVRGYSALATGLLFVPAAAVVAAANVVSPMLAASLLITAAVVFGAAACSVFAWRGHSRESPMPDEPSTDSA
jgi:MFS transporter, DHA2 family, methylenomycin A resistance protein